MAAETDDRRIFRFRVEVEAVLTDDGCGGLWVVPVSRHRFTVVGPSIHPAGDLPCLVGEFFGGDMDGRRFYLEPGWECQEWWDLLFEDA